MYSDLFDHLGGGAGSSGDSNRDRDRDNNEKNLISFKAGKCEMTLQENGKYWITPDTRRGEIRIVWKNTENSLYWEWYDRREKIVSDRYLLTAPTSSSSSNNKSTNDEGTFERVIGAGKESDRIVLWTRPKRNSNEPEYHMFWMQDASEEKDDEVIAEVNQYLADPASGNPNASSASGSSGGSGNANRSDATGGSNSGDASTSSSERQVDALSNILENLGMPQSETTPTSSTNTKGGGSRNAASSSSGNAPTAGTLTLADLQGAMASLQQPDSRSGVNETGIFEAAVAAQAARSSPPLQELVTPEAINSILENEEVTSQLLELLPKEQRSLEYLEDNLRSPQVQQTLRTLTSALLPDDTGSLEGFHSVLANFQLQGANEALVANNNNPILAFLECVQKKVETEKKEKEESEGESKKEEK